MSIMTIRTSVRSREVDEHCRAQPGFFADRRTLTPGRSFCLARSVDAVAVHELLSPECHAVLDRDAAAQRLHPHDAAFADSLGVVDDEARLERPAAVDPLEHGQEQVVGYRSQDFETEVADLDVVLDLVGDESRRKSLNVPKPGGRLVPVMMETRLLSEARDSGRTRHLYIVETSGAELERFAGRIETGQRSAQIDKVLPIEIIADAHAHMQSARRAGRSFSA